MAETPYEIGDKVKTVSGVYSGTVGTVDTLQLTVAGWAVRIMVESAGTRAMFWLNDSQVARAE